MTICIAAIGSEDGDEFIVFATDHMITTNTGQFEHDISKYKKIDNTIIAMLAGHALLFDSLILLSLDEPNTFDSIKKQIHKNILNKKKEIIQNEILDVYGINEKFIIESLKKEIPNPFVNTILTKVSNFELSTSIMLIGIENNKALISEISENGIFDFKDINFHCIGSGNMQASNTLLFQKQSNRDSMAHTIYNVYKAKRNAEVMVGVGKETDVLILRKDGCYEISEENINILNKIYTDEISYGKNNEELKLIRWHSCI